jgi:hypothetical protein
VVPLMKVALDVGWEDTVQCYYLVAERAGGVGDGVGAGWEERGVGWGLCCRGLNSPQIPILLPTTQNQAKQQQASKMCLRHVRGSWRLLDLLGGRGNTTHSRPVMCD